MATRRKAKQPRRATGAHKEAVPDVPISTSMSSSAAALRVVPSAAPADPEAAERAARRRFTAEYKLQILRHARFLVDQRHVERLFGADHLGYASYGTAPLIRTTSSYQNADMSRHLHTR